MAATTLTAFVAALRAVEVSGVKRRYDSTPASITTSDMPALWVHSASKQDNPSGRGSMTWPTLSADLWLVIGPVSQGLRSAPFDKAVELSDDLLAALRSTDLASGSPTVTARVTQLGFGDKAYWGAILTVEVQG